MVMFALCCVGTIAGVESAKAFDLNAEVVDDSGEPHVFSSTGENYSAASSSSPSRLTKHAGQVVRFLGRALVLVEAAASSSEIERCVMEAEASFYRCSNLCYAAQPVYGINTCVTMCRSAYLACSSD